MNGPFGTRLFRITFLLAGCYNLAFGLWVGFWPLQFFKISEIAYPRYPAIWSCLGMVVGLYGLLYLYAAWKPEAGRPIIAVGLLGKVLGPVGMVLSFSDQWPIRLALLNLYNDVIWWLPFTLFLLSGSPRATRLSACAPWCCAGLHGLGLTLMGIILRHGMQTELDTMLRATYIAENSALWTIGWLVWMASALSLVAFYAWWGSRLIAFRAATVGVLLAALGSIFDLSGESLTVLILVEFARTAQDNPLAWDQAGFETIERVVTLLTAGIANLLYSIGGLVLMVWTDNLPKGIRLAMWATWISGAGMTLAALFSIIPMMVATTTVLFPLLITWTLWMGRYWKVDENAPRRRE